MAGQRATEFDTRLGARLVEARQVSGLTQKRIADAIGISGAQWQKYEKGTNAIAVRQLCQAAEAMGLDVGGFLIGLSPAADAPGAEGAQDRPEPSPLDEARNAARVLTRFLDGIGIPA